LGEAEQMHEKPGISGDVLAHVAGLAVAAKVGFIWFGW